MTRTMTIHVSVAMTIDGYIDDRSARRLVLSSDEDLADMRAARARCDAVLVGAGTVRNDDPSLRAPEGMTAPTRVTLTRSGNLDPQARMFDGSARTIVLTTAETAGPLRSVLADRAEVHALSLLTPVSIVASLQSLGIGSLFVEGGTQVLTAFLAAGSFDRLRLAVAPFFAGEGGGARIVDPARFADDAGHRLILRGARLLGDTAVLDYERHPA
ncbi:MAG TPA: RibD family protein [Candidatus Aquilonibacter sp.]